MSYKRKSNECHFSERILRLKNNVMKTWRVMEEITGKNCKPEIFLLTLRRFKSEGDRTGSFWHVFYFSI